MKHKNLIIGATLFFACINSSCTPEEGFKEEVPNDKFAIAIPSGAPTLSAYIAINEGKAEVIKSASNIPAFFSNAAYPFIVFDSTKGLNLIEKAGGNAHYEFEKMLTGGNFHLFAFNKTESEYEGLSVSEESNILGFQKGGTPDKLFKSIYKDVKACDTYFEDITSLKDKLLTMDENYCIDRQKVDYAIVAEPIATVVKGQLSKKGLKILDINLQKEFKKVQGDKWSKDYIPQAGLFIRKDIKTSYPNYYVDIMDKIENSITNVLSDPKTVKESIESTFLTNEEQLAHYGFASSMITSVQGENGSKNGFGIVPNEVKFAKEDIKTFNGLLN